MVMVAELSGFQCPRRSYLPDDRLIIPNCHIGVEVEAENVRLPGNEDVSFLTREHNWLTKADGSLRNLGVEFVLAEPLFGEDLTGAIESLCNVGQEQGWQMSSRTSIHIHLDVRDMKAHHLYNLITFYLIFERVLYRYASEGDRWNNIFCLPYASSDFHLNKLYGIAAEGVDVRQRMEFSRALENFNKYAGLNVLSVLQRGSVEFRHMSGTLDSARIITWVNIIQSLKRAAQGMKVDIPNLPSDVSFNGFENFAHQVFHDLYPHIEYAGIEEDILDGVRVAQDAIYGYQYTQGMKRHQPRRWTGVSPRFIQWAESRYGESCIHPKYRRYDETVARKYVYSGVSLEHLDDKHGDELWRVRKDRMMLDELLQGEPEVMEEEEEDDGPEIVFANPEDDGVEGEEVD